jgi:hypothetical protein
MGQTGTKFTMSSAPATMTQDPLTTPLFKFLIGHNAVEFNLHVGIIDRLSRPLSALIRGPWKESAAMAVSLEDTEPDTFGRLAALLYAGAYVGPDPRRDRRPEDAANRVRRRLRQSYDGPRAGELSSWTTSGDPSLSQSRSMYSATGGTSRDCDGTP